VIAGIEDPEVQVALATRVIDEGMTQAEVVEEVERVAPKKSRTSATKGRGTSKGKPLKLPTERTIKTSAGIKIVASARKGFDDVLLLAMLEEAVAQVRARFEAGQGGESDAA
jgi:hypothetical protein